MTAKKFGKIQGLVLLCLLLFAGTALAASSGVWQQAQFNGVPGGGRSQYNYWAGSHKATVSEHFSISLVRKSPALAVYSALINGNGDDRSRVIPFSGPATLYDPTTAQKGYTYYLRVKSHFLEPASVSTVTMSFSSDNLR